MEKISELWREYFSEDCAVISTEKERELSAVQSTADARWRSVGPISGEGTAFIRDDFLEGFTATD